MIKLIIIIVVVIASIAAGFSSIINFFILLLAIIMELLAFAFLQNDAFLSRLFMIYIIPIAYLIVISNIND